MEAESLEEGKHSDNALVACSWMRFSDMYDEMVLHLSNRRRWTRVWQEGHILTPGEAAMLDSEYSFSVLGGILLLCQVWHRIHPSQQEQRLHL